MSRRVFLLMGLAILAVVVSHAAGWGQVAMVDWAASYQAAPPVTSDQAGASYYILMVIRQLMVPAVPMFLFCAGVFTAYAARGARGTFTWKMARARLTDLLIPFTIWSIVWFAAEAVSDHTHYTPLEYLVRFVTGQSGGGSYFFVPLLCLFYLIAPLIVPVAQTHWRRLLIGAALIQAVAVTVQYVTQLGPHTINWSPISWLLASWLPFMWAFYFPFGLVAGLQLDRMKKYFTRHRLVLLIALGLLAVLAVVEPELLSRLSGRDFHNVPVSLAPDLYSVALIVVLIVFDKMPIPFNATLNKLGGRSYGLYLTHLKTMEYAARFIHKVAPALLTYQVVVIMPVMLVVGLGLPWTVMTLMAKSPLRKYYRYLFG